jgi:hypothetical protein
LTRGNRLHGLHGDFVLGREGLLREPLGWEVGVSWVLGQLVLLLVSCVLLLLHSCLLLLLLLVLLLKQLLLELLGLVCS